MERAPERPRRSFRDAPPPPTEQQAKPNSLSTEYGTGAQPLDTDGAHLPRPPDIVAFVAETPSRTPTRLWRTLGITRAVPWEALRSGIFLVSSGRDSFFTPAAGDLMLQPVHPIMLVAAPTIEEAKEVEELLNDPEFYGGRYAGAGLRVDSEAPDESLAALAAVEDVNSPVRVIVSVGMLKEGWEVANVYVVVSLRSDPPSPRSSPSRPSVADCGCPSGSTPAPSYSTPSRSSLTSGTRNSSSARRFSRERSSTGVRRMGKSPPQRQRHPRLPPSAGSRRPLPWLVSPGRSLLEP